MKVPEAREQAEKLHAKVKLGQDPSGEKADAQSRADETFAACVKEYLTRQRSAVRSSTYKEIERHLLKNLAPLHGLRIDKVDKRGIAAQLARLTSDSGPVQANRTRGSLHKFLNWCTGEGFVESNQAAFTNKNDERPRDRVLSADELREVWCALPAGDFGTILKLLIMTGQREREIADLHWSEIDFDRDIISLPARRTKNRRPHTIPLSPAVRAILEELTKREDRDLVFGRGGAGGFSGWSKSKNALDQSVLAARKKTDKKAKPITPWIIHDLRRSAATGMAKLGIDLPTIEKVLNHQSASFGGIVGTYQHHDYANEKRRALQMWADHVLALVEGRQSNVTPLRA